MTRLSRLHPYPAMIADELAEELCQEFVKPGQYMLDPFCGTGRTLLAAAKLGGHAIGLDINPLATLLVKAKTSRVNICSLERLLQAALKARKRGNSHAPLDIEPGRKVSWFSKNARQDLTGIIRFINRRHLSRGELYLVAAILSATAREVSYSRKDQWKLHRMNVKKRKKYRPSAWKVFNRRLQAVIEELSGCRSLEGSVRAVTGDVRKLGRSLRKSTKEAQFDAVITSPPYGDSYTTVQYGGMSGICLGVIRHLRRLALKDTRGVQIDNSCLGGGSKSFHVNGSRVYRSKKLQMFWYGGERNPARENVKRFLFDMELSCNNIAMALKAGGVAVLVVSRRSTGGWRLKLDKFLIETFRKQEIFLKTIRRRRILKKISPNVVNRRGHAKESLRGSGARTRTMREEIILVFRKKLGNTIPYALAA